MPRRFPFPTVVVAALVALTTAACSAKKDGSGTTAGGSAMAAPSAVQAGTPAPDSAAVRRQIDAANARFAAAVDRGDTATLGASYADDAALLMPGMKAVRSRAAIARAFGDMMGSVKFSGTKLSTDDVMLGGDLAVETGRYEWTITPKGGKAARETGKYVTVWQRQSDGSYRIVRDIANADPAPTK